MITNNNISGADTVLPSFIPDAAGTYVLELMVSDGLESAFDNTAVVTVIEDSDGDGYPADVDCNDDDPSVNPGVPEGTYGSATCSDRIDNDCDALTDTNDPGCSPPDLVVTSVAFTPAKVVRGGNISVTGTIRNRGTGITGESITNYYLSKDNLKSKKDILLTNNSVQSLDILASTSSTTTVTIPVETPPGSYYIIACADDTKQVTESKEKNNCRASQKMLKVKR